MDKKIRNSLLFDFYGSLLTIRQCEIVEMYYNGDYSLSEIAEELNITRQGVLDNIKRAEKSLYEFEEKLGLLDRFLEQKQSLSTALSLINGIKDNVNDKEQTINNINKLEAIINSIVNE